MATVKVRSEPDELQEVLAGSAVLDEPVGDVLRGGLVVRIDGVGRSRRTDLTDPVDDRIVRRAFLLARRQLHRLPAVQI